jgi:hypothetical protein
MALFGWLPLLALSAALAQEPAPFPEERANPWQPAWELTARADQVASTGDDSENFRRAGLQLRLRWAEDWRFLHLEAGTRSAIGSDSNQLNVPRWDQQPSNGSQLDMARVDLTGVTGRTFGTLRLGFQDNPLLASQTVWDRKLRFLGAGASGGFRGAGALLQEAGFRVAAGRVRTILGGDVDLVAGQLVLKVDTGPFSWTAQAARWNLTWKTGPERLTPLPGFRAAARQRIDLDNVGVSGTWNSIFPVEARWSGYRNRGTSQDSEEFQVLFGSRERPWWPQVVYTWQRLSSTGTLYPVNGDEWWFYRGARGPRVDLSLPFPGRWVATVTYMRQRADWETYPVERRQLTILKRF